MTTKTVRVYRDLKGENAKWARESRSLLQAAKVRMVNFIGSPGCGKTALLERMHARLRDRMRLAVLEGDIETTRDADRLAALGIPVSQLLTGGACHLEAKLVHHALRDLSLGELDMVVVENVGNLVCPAEFDIGEDAKIALLSVTEGEDKPLKYPLLFREAKAALLTKADLLPHLEYDLHRCHDFLRTVNADLPIFEVSAKTGLGIEAWLDWLTGPAWES